MRYWVINQKPQLMLVFPNSFVGTKNIITDNNFN